MRFGATLLRMRGNDLRPAIRRFDFGPSECVQFSCSFNPALRALDPELRY